MGVIYKFVLLYIAFLGLYTWKYQLLGKDERFFAKKLSLSLYKYIEYIKLLRNPAMWETELSACPDEKLAGHDYSGRRYIQTQYAYQKRLEKLYSVRPELNELVLESQIIWGKAIRERFDALARIQFNIEYEIQNYVLSLQPNKGKEGKINYDREIVFAHPNGHDKDRTMNEIMVHVQYIESILQPKLRIADLKYPHNYVFKGALWLYKKWKANYS